MPNLYGLVLAGGLSRRMGRDKGSLLYRGEPLAFRAWRLLRDVCGGAFVSVNARQAHQPPYNALPLIVDESGHGGPAAGLDTAWKHRPEAAWLVLAVDMPLVDRPTLESLLAARALNTYATAFRRENGILEPLCAVWEPAARAPLAAQLAAGDASLRRFLERHAHAITILRAPATLQSANDPEAFAELSKAGEQADTE